MEEEKENEKEEVEARNRYFLADNLRVIPATKRKLFPKKEKESLDRKGKGNEEKAKDFLIWPGDSGPRYQNAYSSWLIIGSGVLEWKGAGTGPGHAVARSNGVAWRRVSINYSHNYNRRSLSAVFALDAMEQTPKTRVIYRIPLVP